MFDKHTLSIQKRLKINVYLFSKNNRDFPLLRIPVQDGRLAVVSISRTNHTNVRISTCIEITKRKREKQPLIIIPFH